MRRLPYPGALWGGASGPVTPGASAPAITGTRTAGQTVTLTVPSWLEAQNISPERTINGEWGGRGLGWTDVPEGYIEWKLGNAVLAATNIVLDPDNPPGLDFPEWTTGATALPDYTALARERRVLDALWDTEVDVGGVPADLGALAAAAGIRFTQALPNAYLAVTSPWTRDRLARVTHGWVAAENAFKPKVYDDDDFPARVVAAEAAALGVGLHCHVGFWHRFSNLIKAWGPLLDARPADSAGKVQARADLRTAYVGHLQAMKGTIDDQGAVVVTFDGINEFGLQNSQGGVRGWRPARSYATSDDKGSAWIAFALANYEVVDPGDDPTWSSHDECIYAFIADGISWTREVFPDAKILMVDFDILPDHPIIPTEHGPGVPMMEIEGTPVMAGFGDLKTKQDRILDMAARAPELGFDGIGLQAHFYCDRASSTDGIRRLIATLKALAGEVCFTELNAAYDGDVVFPAEAAQAGYCAAYVGHVLEACGNMLSGIIGWTDTNDAGIAKAHAMNGRPVGSPAAAPRFGPMYPVLARYLRRRAAGDYDDVVEPYLTVGLNRSLPLTFATSGTAPKTDKFGTQPAAGSTIFGRIDRIFRGRSLANNTLSVTWTHEAGSTGTLLDLTPTPGVAGMRLVVAAGDVLQLHCDGNVVDVTVLTTGRNRVALSRTGGEARASANGSPVAIIPCSQMAAFIYLGTDAGGAGGTWAKRPIFEMVRFREGVRPDVSDLEPVTYCFDPRQPLPPPSGASFSSSFTSSFDESFA